MDYSRKNPNRRREGVEVKEFPRGTEERALGNSRGQFKKKWNFWGVQEKIM